MSEADKGEREEERGRARSGGRKEGSEPEMHRRRLLLLLVAAFAAFAAPLLIEAKDTGDGKLAAPIKEQCVHSESVSHAFG